MKKCLTLQELFDNTVKGLSETHPRVATALQKWQRKLFAEISKCSKISAYSIEDIFQDFVMDLLRVDKNYDRAIYCVTDLQFYMTKDLGDICELTSTDKSSTIVINVQKSELNQIQKMNFNALAYRRIEQFCTNVYHTSVTSKRGYYKSEEGRVLKSAEISFQDEVFEGEEYSDTLSSFDYDPEECYMYDEFLLETNKRLSIHAKKILNAVFHEPLLGDQHLVHPLHMPLHIVTAAKKELRRVVSDLKWGSYKTEKSPIYFRASVVR